jgi:hypothetical protein
MISLSKLRIRQAAMKARHHSKPRPYDHARREQRDESNVRMSTMFRLKMSDEAIATAFSISVQAARFLRDVTL